MTAIVTLEGLVDWLMRQRFATLETVWTLSLPDVRRAAHLANPQTSTLPPSSDDLAALMRAFPDTTKLEDNGHGQP
ncbi:MAG: hypothetical protein JJ908_01705 [Rhizobiales bacterium]|nr:hypothetical protein [Hyphomicrobiales bacterium]MBO6698681.1 hypothetical protein [Hyphomicrobiales bacterium]MBO6735066.1 hypothetical protein [Hyphomicrobiales bacterium]MBO6911127.1 hypothetical protein [Hyphomicrobiales bacterium]MBO6955638.1 hypothetical protein [Hyphomicrobiales bacterium]